MRRSILRGTAVFAATVLCATVFAQGGERERWDRDERPGSRREGRDERWERGDTRRDTPWFRRDDRRDDRWDDRRSRDDRRDRGTLRWRGRVDDRAEIVLRGDRVFWRNLSGRGIRDARYRIDGDLPRRPVNVAVRMRDGRGWAGVVQQPCHDNGFTAVIRIVDRSGGADDYDLTIDW